MRVKERAHPFLRRFLNNQEEVLVEGNTVGECIDDLDRKYPGFKQLIVTNGRLLDIFEIYINQDNAYSQELAKPVKEGDVLTIITYTVGG